MPPIPSALFVKSANYLVTSADLLNTVVLGPISASFFLSSMYSSTPYNGVVQLQYSIDGGLTWYEVSETSNGLGRPNNQIDNNPYGIAVPSSTPENLDPIPTPFLLRYIIKTKATLGTSQINVAYA
jgi:hypothetical protein